MPTPCPSVTELLQAWGKGESAALEQLIPAVYEESPPPSPPLSACEGPGHTLPTTGLGAS